MSPTKRTPKHPAYGSRRRAVLGRCAETDKVRAMLVSRPPDVRYLTGFTGEDSWLLFGGGWATLITDGRFAEQARRECPKIDVAVRTGAMEPEAAAAVKKRRIRRLAVQGTHMTVRAHQKLGEHLPRVRLAPVADVVRKVRAVKADHEVRALRKAIRVAERAFKEFLAPGAKALVGRTERAAAARLDHLMRLGGASGPAFETILAAGRHGSLCHYRPGSTVIRRNQAVLVDWGARVGGYCSDLTRVIFTGRIPARIGEIYPVVLEAQRTGIATIRSGVACRTVDAAARAVIAAAGYGEAFRHSLGHGIGLEVHEAPGLARTQGGRLRSGMVVTVEPGIYLPGLGGVRIEDDVLVTRQGPKRLSALPRDIQAMVVR